MLSNDLPRVIRLAARLAIPLLPASVDDDGLLVLPTIFIAGIALAGWCNDHLISVLRVAPGDRLAEGLRGQRGMGVAFQGGLVGPVERLPDGGSRQRADQHAQARH